MHFIVWKLPTFARQGVRSCAKGGSNTTSVFLLCLAFCLVSSVNASCKALVANNGSGRQSAQQVRQYINCMRMSESSYFKRSARAGSYPDRPADGALDSYSTIFTNTDQPYSLDEDSNLQPRQDDILITGSRPRTGYTNMLGLVLLGQYDNNLDRFLSKRSGSALPYNTFQYLSPTDSFLEADERQ